MERWYMLTMFGKDQLGVVARLSAALCKNGCNLGDSSMARLGSNFTIMLMVQYAGTAEELAKDLITQVWIFDDRTVLSSIIDLIVPMITEFQQETSMATAKSLAHAQKLVSEEAERKGAEEMRERCAAAHPLTRSVIRALPLPGDEK